MTTLELIATLVVASTVLCALAQAIITAQHRHRAKRAIGLAFSPRHPHPC